MATSARVSSTGSIKKGPRRATARRGSGSSELACRHADRGSPPLSRFIVVHPFAGDIRQSYPKARERSSSPPVLAGTRLAGSGPGSQIRGTFQRRGHDVSAPPSFVDALSDRYAVARELGRGGMATVYLAHELKHGRPVAFKVLHAELGVVLGPERFLREISLTARLQHPHILPLFDSGE